MSSVMDYEVLRKRMVMQQLIPRGINNSRVLDAFLKVERHKFIPEELRGSAYADYPVPIGGCQTISQPYIVALMTQCLDLSGNEKILEIGTGSGYQTTILSELSSQIYTIERIPILAQRAESLFQELGYSNIKIRVGDGTLGWPEEMPFTRIIVTAATPEIPLPFIEQLSENGKMVLPIGSSFSQVLTLVEKNKEKVETKSICGCVFVPLVGKFANKE